MSPSGDEPDGTPFPFDSWAKALALAGIVAYASIVLSYQRFYSEFGLRPEDLGISQSFILARVLSVIPQVLGVGPFLLFRLVPFKRTLKTAAGAEAFVLLMFLGHGVLATWNTLAIVSGIIAFSAVSFAVFAPMPSRMSVPLFLAIVFVGLMTAESYYMWNQAAAAADIAKSGSSVSPLISHDVPLLQLDIRAEEAVVTWTGAPSQRPTNLFPDANNLQALVLYLGENGSTVFGLTTGASPGRTVRLPAGSVVVMTK